ncbi:hypothetical protein [Melghirimyces algeriensis]|uniref:Uncharacterized protein n=1 Tax=Melghirimyces algeriensis TaxID=910412 RepID=A0A521CTV1_9BACL|nr:hypothetical protein [Melghirimyces algeriensis]SMO62876.1 hypothetical protein SAMN06264849_104180 [Melghirimyces algeriensis]
MDAEEMRSYPAEDFRERTAEQLRDEHLGENADESPIDRAPDCGGT